MNYSELIESCKEYSMAFSGGRAQFLIDAVRLVERESIPGDIVETGVWKGGCCMLMGYVLDDLGSEKMIWMYDTYEGMPEPSKEDIFHTGESAESIWHEGWCEARWEEVSTNMTKVGYSNFRMIKGKVQDTIPDTVPNKISLLRLDTDFYESTKHELEHLYPRLSKNGILIIDDYGSWLGSRKAVDEYGIKYPRQIGTSNAYYHIKK